MKLCLLADGQSPHTRNWIELLTSRGHEVHLISTYPIEEHALPVASSSVVTLDFSAKVRASEKAVSMGTAPRQSSHSKIGRLRGTRVWKALAGVRNASIPLAIAARKRLVRQLILEIDPDLVHAMRVTFEGILAAKALEGTSYPLAASVWGNDFTLFAAGSRATGQLTRQSLERIDGLHPDCDKDLKLARSDWGFALDKPSIVLPGNGGVDTLHFCASAGIRPGEPIVVNPRGLKSYIRNDTFFEAIPLILEKRPDTKFKMCAAKGKAMAEEAVNRLGIKDAVELLDPISHAEMAGLFASSMIVVSPSEHDGTPNTLLEAMACGSYPIAGNIESVREWIQDDSNGTLFDPSSPRELADAVVAALNDPARCSQAATRNRQIILDRADRNVVSDQIDCFYQEVIAYRRTRNAP